MDLDDARFSSLLSEDAPPLINIGTGEDVTLAGHCLIGSALGLGMD